jgi:hypothetical protein
MATDINCNKVIRVSIGVMVKGMRGIHTASHSHSKTKNDEGTDGDCEEDEERKPRAQESSNTHMASAKCDECRELEHVPIGARLVAHVVERECDVRVAVVAAEVVHVLLVLDACVEHAAVPLLGAGARRTQLLLNGGVSSDGLGDGDAVERELQVARGASKGHVVLAHEVRAGEVADDAVGVRDAHVAHTGAEPCDARDGRPDYGMRIAVVREIERGFRIRTVHGIRCRTCHYSRLLARIQVRTGRIKMICVTACSWVHSHNRKWCCITKQFCL